jgi:hypothetical protein
VTIRVAPETAKATGSLSPKRRSCTNVASRILRNVGRSVPHTPCGGGRRAGAGSGGARSRHLHGGGLVG